MHIFGMPIFFVLSSPTSPTSLTCACGCKVDRYTEMRRKKKRDEVYAKQFRIGCYRDIFSPVCHQICGIQIRYIAYEVEDMTNGPNGLQLSVENFNVSSVNLFNVM